MTPGSAPLLESLRCDLIPRVGRTGGSGRELQGLAVLLIALHYAQNVLGGDTPLQFDLGIELLFILWGMTLALEQPAHGGGRFLVRRLIRIVPAYWIILTLYWLCNAHYLQLSYSPLNVVVHYLGIQGALGDAYGLAIDEPLCLIGPLVGFAILYSLCPRWLEQPSRWLLAGAVIAVGVTGAFFWEGQSAMFGYLGLPLPGLFAGVLLGRLLRTGQLDLALGAVLASAAFLLLYVSYINGVQFNATVAALSVMGGYLFGWKRLAPPWAVTLTGRVLSFGGAYWLEILLVHQPLIREYNFYLHGRWLGVGAPAGGTLVAGMAVGLAVTLVFSVALRALLRKLTPLLPIAP